VTGNSGVMHFLHEAWEKLWEQIVVVVPIVAYLIFFKVSNFC